MRVLIPLFLAGCSTAEPLSTAEWERWDDRFFRPASSEATSEAQALLSKSELTLEEALVLADRMNPALAAERKNIDLATAAAWEASLHPNPSLLVEVGDYRTRDGLTSGKMERTVGVGLPLVLSGRIGTATRRAELERDVTALQYLSKRRDILTEVKRSFLTLLAARRTVELARQGRDLAVSVREISDERVRVQAAPEMEALKAAVSLAKADLDFKTAKKNEQAALSVLHALLGNVDFPHDRFVGELARRYAFPSLPALRGEVATIHPLLQAVHKTKEAAEQELALAEAERLPDPEFRLTGGLDPEDEFILEGGLAIPLPLFQRNQGRVSGAKARIRQAELRIESTRNDLVLALTTAHRSVAAAQELVQVYADEILPKTEKALSQTQEGYRLGKFGQLDLLDALRSLAEARRAQVAALLDLNLAAAELEKLTGVNLEILR